MSRGSEGKKQLVGPFVTHTCIKIIYKNPAAFEYFILFAEIFDHIKIVIHYLIAFLTVKSSFRWHHRV